MTCYPHFEDGELAGFICGDLGPQCGECGAISEYQCDYPVGEGKTCDQHLCETDAKEVAPNIHYCSAHHEQWQEFRDSGGIKRVLENVIPFKQGK